MKNISKEVEEQLRNLAFTEALGDCIREAKKAQMAGVTIEDIVKSETALLDHPAKSAPHRQPFGS